MQLTSLALRRATAATIIGAFAASVVLVTAKDANAADVALKLEPGLAIPLSSPQAHLFKVGGSESLKLLFGLTPYLDVGPNASFAFFPSSDGSQSGTVWGLGGGARLKRPHDAERVLGISPWIDADALYIRTGDLNRVGFDVGVGVAVPIDERRMFWVGPFGRFLQTIQTERAGFDNRDARILSLGISLEVTPGNERPREEPRTVTRDVDHDVVSCPDSDGDGVPDSIDRCPQIVGVVEAWGCPKYEKIVVQPDRLELKEKIYFGWDQAKIEEASYPVLDEVAQALKENKRFQIRVEGHADSSGPNDYNQDLSERRADAVIAYLVAHGVPKDRLVSQGFSASMPADSNKTATGRDNNRRVEFVVTFVIVNAGSTK